MGKDNDNSKDDFIAHYFQYQKEYAEAQLLEHQEEIAAFLEFARGKGANLAVADVSYLDKIGIVATSPNLLELLAGGLTRERDGLIPFDAFQLNLVFERPYAGYFQAEKFIPMAHPHFRRGLHVGSHFAPRFIELFWAIGHQGLNKYIAPDEDRVKLDIFFGEVMEKAGWFGAPFNVDVAKIPNGIVKLVSPPDLESSYKSMFFADAHCLDIKWSQDGDVKTFQALEIKSEAAHLNFGGEKLYPARYMHAEYDMAQGAFRHFDGAMQYYTESEYAQRRDSDFNYNSKHRDQIKARSKKLFKLNGPLKTETWSELCCHFFADNPLIFEYFEGSYPGHIIEVLEKIETAKQRESGSEDPLT